MGFQIFTDRDGLRSFLPEVVDTNDEVIELLKKYRIKEIEAGNDVTEISNNYFISIDGISRTKTYFQVSTK